MMKNKIYFNFERILILFSIVYLPLSCREANPPKALSVEILGTWKLVSGLTITGKDSAISVNTKNQSFIKIINKTHFSFLKHDLSGGKDSSSSYDSGGGRYSLKGNKYNENLEYCQEREWENHTFYFTINLNKDTLIQTGIEKIEKLNVNRLNIEKYIRIK